MAAAPSVLKPLQAIEDGWAAFARAPWTFLLFELLAGSIALICALLAIAGGARLTGVIDAAHPVLAGLGLGLGLAGYGIATTWGMVGLVRGAFESLQGGDLHSAPSPVSMAPSGRCCGAGCWWGSR